MRVIGLLGGMSWVSTAHYYELVNRDVATRLGGDHCAPMVVWQTDFDRITELQRAGRWDEAGEILAGGAAALVAAGAEVVGIGANTMHLVADAVVGALGDAELVHIVEVVRDECTRLGADRIGLLGTAYTMESTELYPPTMRSAGIDVLVPDAPDREVIQRRTFDELVRDEVTPAAVDDFRRIAGALVDRGAGAVVLACTEHGLVLRDGDVPVPVLDSTVLHARALVDASLAPD